MEPESSLPCSQEPAAGPYPELDECVAFRNKLIVYGEKLLALHLAPKLNDYRLSALHAWLFSILNKQS
jgi:hypothetical protein